MAVPAGVLAGIVIVDGGWVARTSWRMERTRLEKLVSLF
jgi:hypothetical protein